MSEPVPQKWYFAWWGIAIALISFGPFGLPLLWASKQVKLFWKFFWTVMVLAATVWLTWKTWGIYEKMMAEFRAAGLF